MRLRVFSYLCAVGSAGLLFLAMGFVHAQEEQVLPQPTAAGVDSEFSAIPNLTPTSTASEEANVVYADLEKIAKQYYEQVEMYRDAEKRYLIARETYYQNNTLTAQDEAIRRAKELMQVRLAVLDTYFTYLQHALDQTLGIDLDDKQAVSAQLGSIRADIEIYEELIVAAQDRNVVNVEFNRLNEKKRDFQSTAYATLALMKIGQLQTAVDQSRNTRDSVQEWLNQADVSEAQLAKKQRGLQEVDLLITRAHNNLVEVRDRWRLNWAQNIYSESSYRSFQDSADYTYLQLRQALTFLQEIVNQV